MKISELLYKAKLGEPYEIINEKEFSFFSRITSADPQGAKCVFLAEKKYIPLLSENVKMVITTAEMAEHVTSLGKGVCVCRNPKALYFSLINFVASEETNHFETKIGKNCIISSQAYIAPYDVVINDNVVIEEFACVYEGSQIGDNCVIHSGAKIGIQDYNYYSDDGKNVYLKHRGKTILGKNVDVGFNSIIGRALYDYGCTYIGEDCKISNITAIGHDCNIGKGTMIGGKVVIGGFTNIGEGTEISIGATIKNAISIGKNVHINMGSVVIRDVEDKTKVFGNPAKRILTPG